MSQVVYVTPGFPASFFELCLERCAESRWAISLRAVLRAACFRIDGVHHVQNVLVARFLVDEEPFFAVQVGMLLCDLHCNDVELLLLSADYLVYYTA